MKQLINHHVHSTGSDGKLSPEEVIKFAISKKLNFICFTDHYPYPPDHLEWGKDFHSEKYYNQIKELIEKYKDKIEISFGAEFNWVENREKWTDNEIKKRHYDYVLGSLHDLKFNNKIYEITSSKEKLAEAIKDFSGIKDFAKEYYRQMGLLIKSNLFDAIGHFDVIRMWSETLSKELEKEQWYKEEVIKTLDLAKEKKIVIEINTGGWRRLCKEQYPSFWILIEMRKRNIPITICIDSHYETEIDNGFHEAINLAKKAGYKSILKFKNRKPIEIKI